MRRSLKETVKTDAQIKDAIRDAFLHGPRVMSFNPEIIVRDGLVVLSGTVDNLMAKRAAEQDAKNTVGVWRVKSYLKVRGENLPSDREMAQNVKDALERDPWESQHEINVTVRNGVARLMGTVDSEYEKTRAAEVASRITGIAAVENNLNVSFPNYTYYQLPYSPFLYTPNNTYYNPRAFNRPLITSAPPGTSDAELKDEVEDQLFWSPFVDSDDVSVSVYNGVVTLTGQVDNRAEFDTATENAFEGGARVVINNLRIE
jgi:osmotically-inducible protein OsmY